MKNWIVFSLIILGFLSFSCNSQKKESAINDTDSTKEIAINDTDSAFIFFLGKIKEIQLPFVLDMKSENIENYIETSYGNGRYVPHKQFDIINKQDNKFLQGKYSINDSLLYKALYQKKIGNHYMILITQNDLYTLELYHFKLNSYSLSGKLIDTLTVAGSLPFGVEMSGIIDKNLLIKTKAESYLPEAQGKVDSLPVLHTYSTYKLTNEGFFKKIDNKKVIGFYCIKEGTNYEYEFRPK